MDIDVPEVLIEPEDDFELKDDLHELLRDQKSAVESGARGEALEDVILRLDLN